MAAGVGCGAGRGGAWLVAVLGGEWVSTGTTATNTVPLAYVVAVVPPPGGLVD